MAKKIILNPIAAILVAAIATLKRKISDGNIPGITEYIQIKVFHHVACFLTKKFRDSLKKRKHEMCSQTKIQTCNIDPHPLFGLPPPSGSALVQFMRIANVYITSISCLMSMLNQGGQRVVTRRRQIKPQCMYIASMSNTLMNDALSPFPLYNNPNILIEIKVHDYNNTINFNFFR